jgi:hypothetical protein
LILAKTISLRDVYENEKYRIFGSGADGAFVIMQ